MNTNMKTTLTLIELADMINAHIDAGGVVMDAYGNGEQFPVIEACLDEDWDGREAGVLYLRCPNMAVGMRSCIPDTDRLEIHGHEVHYFSGKDYCGKVVFLNPAPVDLPRAAASAASAAYAAADAAAYAAAYAAAVASANRAVDARDAAAAYAADAEADAAAADAAYVAADAAAYEAYAAMVAARATFHAATV